MPAGIITNIGNITKDKILNKPQYTLILVILLLVFLILSDRLFGLNIYVITGLVMFVFSIIILSTFSNIDKPFNALFNSVSSRNFMSIFLLVFYIIYVYETPEFSSNYPHPVLQKLGITFVSVRTLAMLSVLFLSIMTAYTIYLTTEDN